MIEFLIKINEESIDKMKKSIIYRTISYIVLTTFVILVYSAIDEHNDSKRYDEIINKLDSLYPTEVVMAEKEKAPKVIKTVVKESNMAISAVEYTSEYFKYKGLGGDSDRKKKYGQIPKVDREIWYHTGGSVLDYKELESEVRYIMGRMPNIKSSDGFVALIMETFIAESNLGGMGYLPSYNRGDIGLGQIRVISAKDLLKWLQYTDVVHPSVYKEVMSFYDRNLSLKDNLYKNVQFTIAVAIQEYWRKVPTINDMDLSNIVDRGIIWKSVYNSPLGLGTVEKYVIRVTEFHDTHNLVLLTYNNPRKE